MEREGQDNEEPGILGNLGTFAEPNRMKLLSHLLPSLRFAAPNVIPVLLKSERNCDPRPICKAVLGMCT